MARSESNELEQGLEELRLTRMVTILRDRLRLASDQNWSSRRLLKDLVEEELASRREKALAGRIRRAGLPDKWTLETFPFDRQPGVDKKHMYELAELDWIRQAINIVFMGPTGVGKSGLASSLLMKALLGGFTGLMMRTQDILNTLHESIADRKTKHLLNRFSKIDVLVLDELGYLTLNNDQCNLFFKLMDNRHLARKPTLITTNLGYDDWASNLNNAPMTKALVSRLKQRCKTIVIKGPDLRDSQT